MGATDIYTGSWYSTDFYIEPMLLMLSLDQSVVSEVHKHAKTSGSVRVTEDVVMRVDKGITLSM